MSNKTKYTEEQLDKIYDLIQKGVPDTEISKIIGVGSSSVICKMSTEYWNEKMKQKTG